MKNVFQDGLTYALALLARIATPTLKRQLSRLSLLIVSDVPRLGTTWTASFQDPIGPGEIRVNAVDASFHQFGRYLWGTGHIQGEPGDPFEFRGLVRRNVFYGAFHRKDAHVLAGTGTFVLKIDADSRKMAGYCTWFDSILDDVWHSEYVWTRKG